jgi:hypothetical protein
VLTTAVSLVFVILLLGMRIGGDIMNTAVVLSVNILLLRMVVGDFLVKESLLVKHNEVGTDKAKQQKFGQHFPFVDFAVRLFSAVLFGEVLNETLVVDNWFVSEALFVAVKLPVRFGTVPFVPNLYGRSDFGADNFAKFVAGSILSAVVSDGGIHVGDFGAQDVADFADEVAENGEHGQQAMVDDDSLVSVGLVGAFGAITMHGPHRSKSVDTIP